MVIVLLLMLVVLILSALGTAAVGVFAAVLTGSQTTRSTGLRVFLGGMAGVLITDTLVAIARSNPWLLDQLPSWVQLAIAPLTCAFLMPTSAFAFAASTSIGFASAGGIATLIAVIILGGRKRKETPNQAVEATS